MIKLTKDVLRPSLHKLVLGGLVFAIIPLIVAVISAAYAIDELTRYSHNTVDYVFQTTEQSRLLVEQLAAMERSANQYLISKKRSVRDDYQTQHDDFGMLVQGCIKRATDKQLFFTMKKLTQLAAEERKLYRRILVSRWSENEKRHISERFNILDSLAQEIWLKDIELVETELDAFDEKARAIQKKIVVYSAILLPMTVILGFVFVRLIVRPVRQLDVAIRTLGSGDLEQPIRVVGSRDFEHLGERLDWTRKRLKKLEEEKQTFLQNASHELKTPLAAIYEGVELLADEVVGKLNSEQTDLINILRGSCQRLAQLVEDLLLYYQFQQKRLPRDNIDLSEIIQSVIDDYKINFQAHNISVHTHLDAVRIVAVADSMRAIVENLLSNAVKYSPEGGELTVSLRRCGTQAQLDIEDEGPGINAAEHQHIFEAFNKGHATSTMGIKGTGLGLAIVCECVAAHGGRIEVLSPKSGKKGAFFRVVIPMAGQPGALRDGAQADELLENR